MAWFRRNKTDKAVLPELEKYYDAERRERSGLAWLLALASVASAAVVLIGLFFGGKWLIHRITNDKNKPTAVVQQEASKPADKTTQGTDQKPATEMNNIGTATPAPAPTQTTPSTPAAKPAVTSANLTDTGPGNTVAIFLAVTALSVLFYQLKARKNTI